MVLTDKKILIISPEPWDHHHVSKHHYASELARRGNSVYFLNPPKNQHILRASGQKGLSILDYRGFWKGLHKMPFFLRRINVLRVFRHLEKVAKTRFDIIWSFDNSVFFDFKVLPKRILKISHIVDLNQNFNTRRASSQSDICFGVIPEIVERHLRYNRNSFLIRHAVTIHEPSSEVQLPGENKFKVLYFGNLAMKHLNWNLIAKVSSTKSVDFIFLGSGHNAVPKSVASRKNIFLLESVSSNRLINYMRASSLLILFYNDSYFKDAASPHKVMEYLSSGKPILSMQIPEYFSMSDLISMSTSDAEWIKLLEDILINYSDYQSIELSKKRIAFAKANTYQIRINQISDLLWE